MVERMQYVDNVTYSYSGIFDFNSLLHALRNWAAHAGFEMRELHGFGGASETAVNISKTLSFVKEYSFMHSVELYLQVNGKKEEDIVLEIEGRRHSYDKGGLSFTLDGFHFSWLEHRTLWTTQTTYFYAIKTIFNKFFYKVFEHKYEESCLEAGQEIMEELRMFFETQKNIAKMGGLDVGKEGADIIPEKYKVEVP